VRCCQLRALHDFFPHVSTFLCQIRDLVTDAIHQCPFLYSSACAAHSACYLGIGIMPIPLKRSLLIFSQNCLTITHVGRRLITSIGCRPWLRKLLCFRKCGLIVTSSFPLATFYNRVCSAIMFTSLNSSINRSQTVISLNALCTLRLVFERQFVVSRLLRPFQVGIL